MKIWNKDIVPTGQGGLYKVEIRVEGEEASFALLSATSVFDLCDQMDTFSDLDTENRNNESKRNVG